MKADTERYYRVFAINEAGTGPVSVDPVTAYASVPTDFPPTAPERPALTLSLDAKDPYGKIHISWTKPDDNGSAIVSYQIVEMIDHDRNGRTERVECDTGVSIAASTNPVIVEIDLVPFEGDPDAADAPNLPDGDRYCLLIDEHTDLDDLTAMHAGLTGGEAHYYRVIATNSADPAVGAPSDTRGITTRTPRDPDSPTEPIAVPLAADNSINLYWLDPVNNGGHELGDFRIEARARVRESGPDTDDVSNNDWGAWSEWTSLNNAAGEYAVGTISAKNGTDDDTPIPLSPEEGDAANTTPSPGTDGVIPDNELGEAFNLKLTDAVAGQYKFRIKAKQSGSAARGLDLESSWVEFNKRSRAGLGYIAFPVVAPVDTQIPLIPSLEAKNLDAEEVKDQGIGLTWDPNVGVDHDQGQDGSADTPNVPNFDNPDYRIDVSKDGVVWTRGQTRTIAVRKWDHEGLKSSDIRYYRLFPINHGRFGEAAIAGARAKKAVIASPDKVLNLRQKSATTTSITMEWDEVTAAANYELYSGTPGDNDELPTAWTPMDPSTTEATTLTDSKGLNPGDTRWYRVIALSDDKSPVSGADGAEALGKTDDAGEPGAPVGLVAQQAFDSSLTGSDDRGVLLLWDKPTEAGKDPHTSYTVEWKSSTQTGDAWETLVTDTTNLDNQTPKSTHYHHDSELETDEQRAYQVKALSGSGSGMASNVSYYPPMTAPPATAELTAPTMLNVVYDDADPNDIKVRVSWEDGDNAVGHLVMLFTSDFVGDPQVDATPTGSMSEFDVSDGSYIAVVVSYDADPNIELEISDVVPAGN